MRRLVLLSIGLIACVPLVVFSGCGAAVAPTGGSDAVRAGTLAIESTYLLPLEDDPNQTPRWMDIADYLYSSTFSDSFQYPGSMVALTYTTQESPLQFSISAPYHALKPNFCYQMKLEGPPQPWHNDPDGNDFENYQLGSNGRWWCDTCNRSLTDQEVASGDHTGHDVKGYLYFDFLVTDKDGSVEQTSTANNSYHVTWKTNQRRPGADDGLARTYNVVANVDGWAYDRRRRPVKVGIYGEWEPGRPLPGHVALASGVYRDVELRLTEESFHSPKPAGGNWRTVMVAPGLAFEISDTGTDIHDVAITDISLPGPPARAGKSKSVKVTVRNEGTVTDTTDVVLSDDKQAVTDPSSMTITLGPSQSTVAEFTWTPGEKGEHMLDATATVVEGESDTADNAKTRIVKVR